MEIGLIYSERDPRQTQARDFLRNYIDQHGILARIVETKRPVKSPTIIVNGEALMDMRRRPRRKNDPMFPSKRDIEHFIERHLW